jgi:hypothetical protein
MLETYAFFAAFTVQILAMSVLYPARFGKYVRIQTTRFPAERFAQLYPNVDRNLAAQRFVTRYRALNTGIAVLGLLLLGWLFSYMRRPDWDDGPVEALIAGYFVAQMTLQLGLVAWIGVRYGKVLKHSLARGKRKAVLQRRGLFDFVSPPVVFLAILGYFLFAALVIYVEVYIEQDPFSLKECVTIGGVTLVYALNAFVVYTQLYGRTSNPLETHARRIHTIGLTVKGSVYSCLLCVVYLSLNLTLERLDLERWAPFALSSFFTMCAFLSARSMPAPPRPPEADGLGHSPVS